MQAHLVYIKRDIHLQDGILRQVMVRKLQAQPKLQLPAIKPYMHIGNISRPIQKRKLSKMVILIIFQLHKLTLKLQKS